MFGTSCISFPEILLWGIKKEPEISRVNLHTQMYEIATGLMLRGLRQDGLVERKSVLDL